MLHYNKPWNAYVYITTRMHTQVHLHHVSLPCLNIKPKLSNGLSESLPDYAFSSCNLRNLMSPYVHRQANTDTHDTPTSLSQPELPCST